MTQGRQGGAGFTVLAGVERPGCHLAGQARLSHSGHAHWLGGGAGDGWGHRASHAHAGHAHQPRPRPVGGRQDAHAADTGTSRGAGNFPETR